MITTEWVRTQAGIAFIFNQIPIELWTYHESELQTKQEYRLLYNLDYS